MLVCPVTDPSSSDISSGGEVMDFNDDCRNLLGVGGDAVGVTSNLAHVVFFLFFFSVVGVHSYDNSLAVIEGVLTSCTIVVDLVLSVVGVDKIFFIF